MAITVDSRNAGALTTGATTLSWSHTVAGALSNSILLVLGGTNAGPNTTFSGVNWDDTGTPAALSKTINGVSADQDGAGASTANLWFLLSPVSGTKTIKITAAATSNITAGSASYAGVAQTSTFNAASPQKTNHAANVNPTTAVTSAVNELVVDVIAVDESGANTAVVGAGQTQIFNQDIGAGSSLSAGSEEAGAASVTMNWTGLTTNNAGTGQVCVSLVPAVATVPGIKFQAINRLRPRVFAPGLAR